MRKKMLLTILSLATLLFVSCTNNTKNVSVTKDPNTKTVENNGEEKEDTEKNNEKTSNEGTGSNKSKNITLDFYVPNNNADGFDIVQKDYEEIDLVKIVQDSILESNSSYKETKVLGVEVKDGVAYVDLTSQFFDDSNSNSSAGARAKVYSIVNTLCFNEDLEILEVTFLKEGAAPETIGPLENGMFQPREEL